MASKSDIIRINTAHSRDGAQAMLNNLLTAPVAEHGVDWYQSQRDDIEKYSQTLGVSKEIFTAIVAHLSPQTKWNANISMAWDVVVLWQRGATADMIKSVGMPTFGKNIDKAVSVLNAGDAMAAKFGPKTWSFYRNLMGDKNVVTVDRHHAMIMLGYQHQSDVSITAQAYDDMVWITQVAAEVVGMHPADFQAALWVARRDALGIID